MLLKFITLAHKHSCAGRKAVLYFGAVDREWATLSSFVKHQIEKLVKGGLLVAKKAYSTHDDTGILSLRETNWTSCTLLLYFRLVRGPDLSS